MGTNAYYLNQFISTTLATVGGIDDSQTTGIILTSVTGVETTKPGIVCLSYSDPIDTSKAEWITYTSIDGTNELQGVTRGAEGFSAKSHSNGVTVAFPISKSHINNLNDALIIDGAETNLVTGVISPTGTSSDADTELVTKSYADGGLVNSMSRQAIINGNFDVWQRGTSISISSSAIYGCDRFADYAPTGGGTNPTLTRTREILTSGDIPNSFYYSRLTTNGAGSSFGNDSGHFYWQKIEHGTRLLCGNGKKVTVSFYARSSIANKRFSISLQQNYGSGGSPSATEVILPSVTAITLNSTWTKYIYTFTTNTLVGKTFGTNNNDHLGIFFIYRWGTTYGNTHVYPSITAESYVGSGTIDIAQVQLCAGEVALPFQPKSFEEELRACERYFCKTFPYGTKPEQNAGIGGALRTQAVNSTSFLYHNWNFPVRMRTTPSITTYNPSAANNNWRDENAGIDKSVAIANQTDRAVTIIMNTTGTEGNLLAIHATAEAEL